MSRRESERVRCDGIELVGAYVLHILPAQDLRAAEAHFAVCPECREQLDALRPIIDSFVTWPTDVLRPSPLWDRVARRIAQDRGTDPIRATTQHSTACDGPEPLWQEVSPGIFCKILATDADRDRVSMLVRLAPGVSYPPHEHAAVEELYLLSGELWINDARFEPGDHHRAEAGTEDWRVWSKTGCTCVLITSPSDVLR